MRILGPVEQDSWSLDCSSYNTSGDLQGLCYDHRDPKKGSGLREHLHGSFERAGPKAALPKTETEPYGDRSSVSFWGKGKH